MYKELDEVREAAIHEAKGVKPKELEAGPCRCGGKFVLKQNRKNKEYFYGCSNYTRCTETKQVDIPPLDF